MMRSAKKLARTVLRRFGYDIASKQQFRPTVFGSQRILGSFPPKGHYTSIGPRESYFIHDGYTAREQPELFDDTADSGPWQEEVYQFAREIRDREDLTTICDIGCGSGTKLISQFGAFHTVGVELPETCQYLRRRWPARTWTESNLSAPPAFRAELVIAADVVEHLLNPDDLMTFIGGLQPSYVVLSTPDRNLLRDGGHDGPPRNPPHVREWSFLEFEAYVDSFFEIEEHFISSCAQATQCLLCTPRRAAK